MTSERLPTTYMHHLQPNLCVSLYNSIPAPGARSYHPHSKEDTCLLPAFDRQRKLCFLTDKTRGIRLQCYSPFSLRN